MSRFISSAELRHAVKQLAESSAKGRTCEYLIGLRTLAIAGEDEIGVSESIPEFVQALTEFTRWAAVDDEDVTFPYFNPFDAITRAYKFKRYPSNGPSNTMHGWSNQSDSPFEINGTVRPKAISKRNISPGQLQSFLLKKNGEETRPRLIDVAVWFYRSTDLQDSDGKVPDRDGLESRFAAAVGLSDDEITALFRREDEDRDEDALPNSVADESADAVTPTDEAPPTDVEAS